MSWKIAILKILAARSDGEASVSDVSRDMAVLVGGNDGWMARQRGAAGAHCPDDLFTSGFVTRPAKGRWRISAAGRGFLRDLDRPQDVRMQDDQPAIPMQLAAE